MELAVQFRLAAFSETEPMGMPMAPWSRLSMRAAKAAVAIRREMQRQAQLGGAGFQRALPVAFDTLRVRRQRRRDGESRRSVRFDSR